MLLVYLRLYANCLTRALVLFVFWIANVALRLGSLGLILFTVGGGALLHLIMVFRGHLFEALDGTSHRQRMHRYRAGL